MQRWEWEWQAIKTIYTKVNSMQLDNQQVRPRTWLKAAQSSLAAGEKHQAFLTMDGVIYRKEITNPFSYQ
jgi:hypothetical protein